MLTIATIFGGMRMRCVGSSGYSFKVTIAILFLRYAVCLVLKNPISAVYADAMCWLKYSSIAILYLVVCDM